MTDQRRRLNPYVSGPNGRGSWIDGVVPYVIDHPTLNRGNWMKAVTHYHANTPIRLQDVTNSDPRPDFYIRVFQGPGCFAVVGRIDEIGDDYDGNILSLGGGCDSWLPTIVHEIGHSLGFHHTHKRSDRDQHINVFYENILEAYWGQYAITPEPHCGEYDCGSVMHYFDTAFANGEGKTMEAINPNTCIIQRDSENPLSYW
eukprot:CAMPEP_0114671052 /NCGR_PEP_ID=MMETSP0191-20121206/40504_1 /TAXON_ID=126664 /ORGANISM="Sorites sp." /LENGTH=200 /DNA_ID=CAMNT_0001929973 /DNA_START=180 /DNA_END=779 /DNA_ORIENTATION=-